MTGETLGDAWLRPHLDPGERILWLGQPDRRRYVFDGQLVVIPFTLAWLAFAIFWMFSVTQMGAPVFFLVWGAGFVLIGLYLAFGRLGVAAWEADRTRYAITDQRVAMRTGAFTSRYTEMRVDDLPTLQLEEGRGGIGTISFGPQLPLGPWMRMGWPGFLYRGTAFTAIPDVASVFRTLSDAKQEAHQVNHRGSG